MGKAPPTDRNAPLDSYTTFSGENSNAVTENAFILPILNSAGDDVPKINPYAASAGLPQTECQRRSVVVGKWRRRERQGYEG